MQINIRRIRNIVKAIFFQYEIIKLEFSGIVLLTHAEWKPDKNI